MMRPAGRTLTVTELVAFLSGCDPDLEVVGKVSGGLVSLIWITDEGTDEDGEDVVMIGLDT